MNFIRRIWRHWKYRKWKNIKDKSNPLYWSLVNRKWWIRNGEK